MPFNTEIAESTQDSHTISCAAFKGTELHQPEGNTEKVQKSIRFRCYENECWERHMTMSVFYVCI